VTDTPNTIGNQTMSLNSSSCGSADNMQNFMEYTYLNSMFTEGQKVRMYAALNSPIANRNNLWTNPNLIATGVIDNATICTVDFEADKRYFCVGEIINFTDVSSQSVINRTWFFEGGSPASSSDSSVAVTYNTPGVYEVKLVVSNGVVSDSIIKSNYIEVFESPSARNGLAEDFEHLNGIDDSHWFTDEIEDTWEISTTVGKNSSKSVMLSNFDDFSGRKTYLYSKPIDASNASYMVLYFDFAFAKKTVSSNDNLRISVSRDCGDTWYTRKTLSSSVLSTVSGPIDTLFVPTNNDWVNIYVGGISTNFNPLNVMLRFEFTSGNGNNIYIDNIYLYDAVSANIKEPSNSTMSIYPNPTNGLVYLDFNHTKNNPVVSIYDVTGKLIKKQQFNGALLQLALNTQSLTKGIYFIAIDGVEREVLVVE
jgi:PKD repeat protein